MSPSAIRTYLKETAAIQSGGEFTEHSFRGALQKLLQAHLPGVDITNEPGRIMEGGAPDYVLKLNQIPLGYIEAKNIDKSLDDKAFGDQFNRYLQSLDNLIFTNYLEFRFHRNAETKPVATVAIAELHNGKIKPRPQNFTHFENLIANFGAYQGQTITTAADLAGRMADKAKLLAQNIAEALAADEKAQNLSAEDSELKNQLKGFRETLIADIKPAEFAGIYAQTVAYGMFAARLHDPTPATFTRQEAAELIPKSNPFLRKLFQHIAGYELDSRIRWIVDDLADIFRASEVHELMKDYGRATQQNDPFLHFYETFLGAYDSKLRKSRGVWYTPEPVVNFIVRAVDAVLKSEFGLRRGLADSAKISVGGKAVHRVQILDPAAGTGTFLADIVKFIHASFRGQHGVWPDYARDDLIPRLHGFEILMASYAMAHVKLEMILNDTECKLRAGQRLQVFLTDSLENRAGAGETKEIPFAQWLVNEAKGAEKVKRDTPVMVVMGNPPYSAISQNKGKWIKSLIEEYKHVDGEHFGERKHWLDDDYVKFIRYGQHYIDRVDEGVLAYISNHSFLDNVTFRGMRWHLLRSFDKIFVLDLHGNAKKKEKSPDGSPDKNVFDIMQGVSISIFVKTGKKAKNALGEVFHCDLFGERESKYEFLWNHEFHEVGYEKLSAVAPYYFFVPKDFGAIDEYEKGFSVADLSPVNVSGIVTARDSLVIDMDKECLVNRIKDFSDAGQSDQAVREKYFGVTSRSQYPPGDTRGWKLSVARNNIKDYSHGDMVKTIAYRPFDNRYVYYTPDMIDWGREKLMRHFFSGENVGLIYKRGDVEERSAPVFVTEHISESRSWSRPGMQGGEYSAPLYVYPDEKQENIGDEVARKPNLNADIVQQIAAKLGMKFTPEKTNDANTFAPLDILDYIYAVLHSPTYRKKFREFLKIDFPRVPFPRDRKQFRALAKLGAELRALHLMESEKLNRLITTYPEPGDNTVTTVKFEAGKARINATQYFGDVPPAAWAFYIGGYQPAQKYLKDRKSRALTPDEIHHYQQIIVALVETAKVMKQIDAVA